MGKIDEKRIFGQPPTSPTGEVTIGAGRHVEPFRSVEDGIPVVRRGPLPADAKKKLAIDLTTTHLAERAHEIHDPATRAKLFADTERILTNLTDKLKITDGPRLIVSGLMNNIFDTTDPEIITATSQLIGKVVEISKVDPNTVKQAFLARINRITDVTRRDALLLVGETLNEYLPHGEPEIGPQNPPLSLAQETALSLLEEGHTHAEVAELMEIDLVTALNPLLSRIRSKGYKIPRGYTPVTEQYQRIRDLLNNGSSIDEIAQEMGLKPATVKKYIFRMNYPDEKTTTSSEDWVQPVSKVAQRTTRPAVPVFTREYTTRNDTIGNPLRVRLDQQGARAHFLENPEEEIEQLNPLERLQLIKDLLSGLRVTKRSSVLAELQQMLAATMLHGSRNFDDSSRFNSETVKNELLFALKPRYKHMQPINVLALIDATTTMISYLPLTQTTLREVTEAGNPIIGVLIPQQERLQVSQQFDKLQGKIIEAIVKDFDAKFRQADDNKGKILRRSLEGVGKLEIANELGLAIEEVEKQIETMIQSGHLEVETPGPKPIHTTPTEKIILELLSTKSFPEIERELGLSPIAMTNHRTRMHRKGLIP